MPELNNEAKEVETPGLFGRLDKLGKVVNDIDNLVFGDKVQKTGGEPTPQTGRIGAVISELERITEQLVSIRNEVSKLR